MSIAQLLDKGDEESRPGSKSIDASLSMHHSSSGCSAS